MNVMKLWRCAKYITVIAASSSLGAQAAAALSLPLTCYQVPLHTVQLCVVVTRADYGPFDDVVFYRQDAQQQLTYLRSVSGGVATFSVQDFSANGEVVALAWAEEGHPTFEFYRTADLLTANSQPEPLAVLAEYPFSHLDVIGDDGQVLYGSDEPFDAQRCAARPALPALSDPQLCHRLLQLPDTAN